MTPMEEFDKANQDARCGMAADTQLQQASREWFAQSSRYRYSYQFTWLGVPIIQYPQDMVALQEIVWRVRPDLVIETGIAHGGSLLFYASLLALLGAGGRVLGIDTDIRPHNRAALEAHPLFESITLRQGSSVDPAVVAEAREMAGAARAVLVVLDSNHTHAHVRAELAAYAPLVTEGSYLVVFDTVIEQMPEDAFPNRPWGRGDNPHTAVQEFLQAHPHFKPDAEMDAKLLLTAAPGGFLQRVSAP